jgi:hypothetical protein
MPGTQALGEKLEVKIFKYAKWRRKLPQIRAWVPPGFCLETRWFVLMTLGGDNDKNLYLYWILEICLFRGVGRCWGSFKGSTNSSDYLQMESVKLERCDQPHLMHK